MMEGGAAVKIEGGDSQLNAQWARVRGRLRTECGDAAFRSWLKPLVLVGHRDPEVRLAVPTRFMRDWVDTHYGDRLRALWAEERPTIRAVAGVVDSGRAQAATPDDDGADERRSEPGAAAAAPLPAAARGDR